MKRNGHLSRTYNAIVGTTIVFLLTLFAIPVSAQEKIQSNNENVPHFVRVKIAREFVKDGIAPSFFGDATTRYGIVKITPWLNPDLLRYIDRKAGLYKRNGNLNGHIGGSGFETSAQSLMRIMVVQFSSDESPKNVARALATIAGVEYAEPISYPELLYTPNDPNANDGKQWHLDKIKAYDAWDEIRGDSSIVIAIVDTGIERDHSDLKKAIWYNLGESGGGKESNSIDDDNNGYVDDWWGYDLGGVDGFSPDNDPNPGAEVHGVHVAGIAGATGDNDIFGAGVAYGVKLMAVKISNDARPAILPKGDEGILYAAAMGANVINCSWGDTQRSNAQEELVRMVTDVMGVMIVAAAGNDTAEKIRYPARYNHVLSVAATTKTDSKKVDSDYHYYIGISAPGEGIYSTWGDNGFASDGGTSMASPMVAGAAALLLSKDPTLSREELTEILRSTADNIDLSLGQYVNKMGSGRLNAGRAVEKMKNFASARMTDYTIEEEEPDGILSPGEKVTIRANIKNFLAPSSGVRSIMSSVEPVTLGINNDLADLGAMASGQIQMTGEGIFHFTVPVEAAPDSRIVLKVTTSTEDKTNNDFIVLSIYPTFGTTDLNNIASTFNSVGNIGYNGLSHEQGDGFYFGTQGSLLWHGGLMVGTSATTLIDVVRRGAGTKGTNDGFMMISPYRLERNPENTVEKGAATFTDRNGILGIDVDMTSYEYKDDSNYVLLLYKIKNTSGGTISKLHCGLYLDWDLEALGTGDQASYDPEHKMGFVRNLNKTNLLVGAALISDQTPDYYAIDNTEEGITVESNFTNSLKWNMLSNGVSRTNTQVGTDVSMVIGGGPVTIAPGESETFVFGLLGAHDFTGLKNSAERARDRLLQLGVPTGSGDPTNLILTGTAPNPFSNATILTVDMPASEHVRLEVFDAQGRSVRLLHDGILTVGHHTFQFNRDDLPSGVYFYKVEGENVTARGSMILTQ